MLVAVLGVLVGLLAMHILALDQAVMIPLTSSHAVTSHAGAKSAEAPAETAGASCPVGHGCAGAGMQAPCTPGSAPHPTPISEPGSCAAPASQTGTAAIGRAAHRRPPARAPSLIELSINRT
ncbi:DUF6153 family protein [Tersicoccus solisilvae]|uniref:DUF6153 family protein n=1 Tax=Tersicoccus TaxID=1418588 RepID=UPI0034D40D18